MPSLRSKVAGSPAHLSNSSFARRLRKRRRRRPPPRRHRRSSREVAHPNLAPDSRRSSRSSRSLRRRPRSRSRADGPTLNCSTKPKTSSSPTCSMRFSPTSSHDLCEARCRSTSLGGNRAACSRRRQTNTPKTRSTSRLRAPPPPSPFRRCRSPSADPPK